MKKCFLCLVLALCLLAPMALAEDIGIEEQSAPTLLEKLDSAPEGLFVVGNTLYAQSWPGLVKKVENGWLQYNLNSEGSVDTICAAEDGFYILCRYYEVYNPATDSWEKPESGMFAIQHVALDEEGAPGKPEPVCGITWAVNEDNYPQIDAMMIQDGSAYISVHDDDMNWDKLALYRVDLTTGQGTKVLNDYLTGFIGYKDGLMLARYANWEELYDNGNQVKQPEVATIDLASGEITRLAELTSANAGSMVYDAATDSVYFADATLVYRFDSSFSAPTAVGYLIGGSSYGRSNGNAVLYKDRYLIGDWDDEERILSATIDPALLPSRTLRITNAWYSEEAIRAYAKAHPDVAIEYIELSGYTAEFYQSHMQSPQAADIYMLSLPYSPYAALEHYGLLTDLSGSEKLLSLVSSMYPNMTSAYLKDGKLYGLPVSISASVMGYYPAAFEKIGLSEEDVPATFDELMDFLLDWYYDYYDDYSEISLFEWSPELRDSLFSLIFQQQVLNCQAANVPLTFKGAEMQKLLGRLDSQEMRTVMEELGPKRDESGNIVTVFEWSEEPTSLFSSYANPMPSRYQSWNPPKTLLLRMSEDDDPAIQASVSLLVINRASQNQDLAMDLLEYISENLYQDLLTAMVPDVADPIEVSYYQDNIAFYQERIAEYQKELDKLENADPDDEETALMISSYQENLQYMQDRLVDIEENERWAFSAEDILYYKESIAPYLVVADSSIFTGTDNPAQSSIQRYIDGAMDAASFISEIDRIVNMMQMEGR